LGETILNVLNVEQRRGAQAERAVVLMGLTAALRARPADAGKTIALFLTSPHARVRADAANALARLRAKDGVEQLRPLLNDADAVGRASAARAPANSENKAHFDALL